MRTATATVLIVEDDPANRAVLRMACQGAGLEVVEAATGTAAVEMAREAAPDIVLLDLSLPDISGLEVCRRLRAAAITAPLMVVSGSTDLVDVVVALEIGADDYVRKPYPIRELLARLAAHLRRSRNATRPSPVRGVLEYQGLSIDLGRRRVYRDGTEVRLSGVQYQLLTLLASRPGTVVPRNDLLDVLSPGTDRRTVDVHIHRLRRRLADRPETTGYITAITGVGYRFDAAAAAAAA
ncbi:MAG TPA: response regulator transcription factor [Candidatus Dormibacteraeota bacterium]|jgi:DNA-binding response OmpR family regulator|nr:response regulator transcription factor [Candidatus Dormibacteraeota bacterium]